MGKSEKFILIIKSIFKSSNIKIYPWRSLKNLRYKNEKSLKKPNIIFVCGYDYMSQWYSFKKYYDINVLMPLNFIKFLADKKTQIFYVDTINKVFTKDLKKNLNTFSRYEFAKKKLALKLYKNFKNIKIIQSPPIKEKKEVLVFGGFLTKFIFKLLIRLKLIKTIDIKTLKKEIIFNLKIKKKLRIKDLNPIFLSVPRSLFLDRLLRFILD